MDAQYLFFTQIWTFDIIKENYIKYNLQIHDVISNQSENKDTDLVIEMLEWLYDKIKTFQHFAFPVAAKIGNLSIMKWLFYKGCEFDYALLRATDNGNIDNITWLLANGCPRMDGCFSGPAKKGNLELMKWLYENDFKPDSGSFSCAAEKGIRENMIWLYQIGCPFDEHAIISIIGFFGQENLTDSELDNIKWFLDNGCSTGLACSQLAATRGDLRLLQLLKDHKCRFNTITFQNAIKSNNIQTVLWLHKNKCPHKKNVITHANTEEMILCLKQLFIK